MWGSILILKVSKWLNYFLGAQRALVASVLRNPKKIQYRAAFPVVFIIFFQMCGSYCKRSRILSHDIEQLVSVMLSKLCSLTDVLNINRLFVMMLVWCSTLCCPLSIPVFQWPNHFGYPFLAVSAFAYLGMWPPLLPWRRHLAFGAKIVNMLNPMVIHDSVRFGVNRKIFLGYPEGPSKYYSQQKFRLHIWRHEISQNQGNIFLALTNQIFWHSRHFAPYSLPLT